MQVGLYTLQSPSTAVGLCSGLEGGMQLQWDGDGDGDGLCCILPIKWPGVCGPKRKSA